jgi:hypothetical protein
MATGPEHYKEAERLLTESVVAPSLNLALAKAFQANAHATLALVAARVPIPRDHRAWAEAFNGEPAPEPVERTWCARCNKHTGPNPANACPACNLRLVKP